MRSFVFALTATVLALPALAEGTGDAPQFTGDAAAGATAFDRQCISCHVVRNEAGDVLAGRNGRIGPNLFKLDGRAVAGEEGFKYGDSIAALGETGAVWDEATFVPYVMDPTKYLREALSDNRARSKMAFRVRDEQDALDIYAFIHSLGE